MIPINIMNEVNDIFLLKVTEKTRALLFFHSGAHPISTFGIANRMHMSARQGQHVIVIFLQRQCELREKRKKTQRTR